MHHSQCRLCSIFKTSFECKLQHQSLLPQRRVFSRGDNLVNPRPQSSYTWSRRVSFIALLLPIWRWSYDRSKQSTSIRRGGADEERGARIASTATSPRLFPQAGRAQCAHWASLPASIGGGIFLASTHPERNLMKQFLWPEWLLPLSQDAWSRECCSLAREVGTSLR